MQPPICPGKGERTEEKVRLGRGAAKSPIRNLRGGEGKGKRRKPDLRMRTRSEIIIAASGCLGGVGGGLVFWGVGGGGWVFFPSLVGLFGGGGGCGGGLWFLVLVGGWGVFLCLPQSQ